MPKDIDNPVAIDREKMLPVWKVMRCKDCGYDLLHLDNHRCPECGRPFDPWKRITFLREPISGRRLLLFALTASMPSAVLLLLYLLLKHDIVSVPVSSGYMLEALYWPLMCFAGLLGMAITMHVLMCGVRLLRGRLPWYDHGWSFVLAVTLSLLLWLGHIGIVAINILDRIC